MALLGNVLFAVLAAASVSAYTDHDLTAIDYNVGLCLRDLPNISGRPFTRQINDICGMKAWLALYEVADQTELTPVVVKCVQGYSEVSTSQVATVEKCLIKKLDSAYIESTVTPDEYTDAQMQEILGRVAKCLEQVPLSGKGSEPREVCQQWAASSLSDGISKENLEDATVRCLQNREFTVSQDVVSKVKPCLRQELDQELTTRK